jgi:hypothetical protein
MTGSGIAKLTLAALAVALVAVNLPDTMRYLRIRRM